MGKKFLHKTAFTFIEMLFVTALLSIVGVSLYSALSNGVRIWQRITQESAAENINIFFEKLSFDLRNSFSFSFVEFEGDENEIIFPAIVQSVERSKIVQGIGRISYSFDREQKTLNKKQSNFSQIYQNKFGFPQMLVNRIEKVRFQYYYYDSRKNDYFWISTWPEEDISFDENKKEIYPLAVRIEIEALDDHLKRKFTRTISIPAGYHRPRLES